MAFDIYVNLSGWFIRDVSKSVSKSVTESVTESVSRSVTKSVTESVSKSVTKSVKECYRECFKTFLSSLCDRRIGPGIAVHCAGIICCAKLRNQTMCAVDLVLMAETRSILQALPI
jgi:hypothetical protein